jgi:hypothetical protein
MANVFGILTAIVLSLACFVAYKNKDAYANELDHRKNEERKLAASQDRLKTARDNLAATQKERSDTEAEVAQLRAQEEEQKKGNTALKADIDAKTQLVDANKKRLDDIRAKTAPVGEIKELANKVKTMRTEMEDTKQSIANNETKLANLTAENIRMEGLIKVMKTETEMITRRESFFTKTRINSIYPNWGFVTLGAGNTSGMVTGSTLEVIREGAVVAKLLVTAVESNTASATIIPDSLAEGTVLMVGDQVAPSHKPVRVPAKPVKKPGLTPDAPSTAPDAVPDAVPATVPDAEPKPEAPVEPTLDLGPDLTADPAAKPEAKPAAEAESN